MEDKKKPGAYTGYTEARKAANARYEANTVERVSLVLPKGKKETIQNAAASQGQSVNAYINQAIDRRMERGNGAAGVSKTDTPAQTPEEAAQTLKEAKRIVWAAGNVILPSLLRESVAEASRAAGETDDAFLWRAVSGQAEQDREKRKAAVNAADAPQGILIPIVVSLSLDELERAERAAKAAGEGVTEFIRRTIKAQTAAGRKSGGGNAKSGGKRGKHGT